MVEPANSGSTELDRLRHLYASFRQINQAIVGALSRTQLFDQVCDALVTRGGFRMAWIGWHDPATRRIVPVSQAGDEQGYLGTLVVSTDDRPEGRGPSGVAFREQRPYVCNDVAADPATAPWRAQLEARGLRASVALPFRCAGQVCGTLSVYAGTPGFFEAEEIQLLTQAAADLSFGVDHLAREDERRRAEAQAERERRFASSLIEAMPGIFYLYDEKLRFLRWNKNFERVSGYSAEEIASMAPLDFFEGADRPLLAQRIADTFARGYATAEAAFVAKDGRATPYFFTGKQIELDGATCLIGVGVDVSEKKRAEDGLRKSEVRYRTTLDNILEGCQLLDFDWRYLYLNSAAATQNRRPKEELLGQRMQDAWPGIEATAAFALLRRCMLGRVAVHEEIEFTFPDGASAWFDLRAQPVPEGIFILSIDISERRRAERALRDLNESLELKVAERTRDLTAARERAEAADRIKSAFLATMSHELRTPLNSIIGFTGIILQGLAGPLNPEQSKQLGMVRTSARHLLDLINDVLDISKIEAGQLEVRSAPFELGASVARVVASVRPLAEKKGLGLRVQVSEPGLTMESDQRRVEQILLNLLNNAIKFTEHGEVALVAERVQGGEPAVTGPAVRLRVSDSGIGMHEADLALLFQPFRQLDSGLERQHEGTGLGLAICRRLCSLLGGTISAQSTWGQGSVFTVVLPVKR